VRKYPTVFVLVLNYCSAEETLDCVKLVRRVDYPRLKLLVIDNASPDGGGGLLRRTIPQKEFIELNKNSGYAGGNNLGISIAIENGADYVMICNPDVRLSANSIKSYVSIFEMDSSIGALNPIQLSGNGDSIDPKFQQAIMKPGNIEKIVTNYLGKEVLEVKTLFGAALMLSRRAIETVGGFDPLFFAYGEEEDLCRRIRNNNFKLAVTKDAPVVHLRTNETKGISDFVLFLRLKGSYLYELKEPRLGYRYAVKKVLKKIFLDLGGKRRGAYPFNTYKIRHWHIIRSLFWVLFNLQNIHQHREIEKGNNAYIFINTKRKQAHEKN
jgi:GT2 family glycosyltransferase